MQSFSLLPSLCTSLFIFSSLNLHILFYFFPKPSMEPLVQDHFDRLPDALLHLIFNRVLDAKALTRCLLVCKRFSSIVPHSNALFLSIPPPGSGSSSFVHLPSSRLGNGWLRLFLSKFVAKPLKHFRRMFALKSTSLDKDWKAGASPYSSLGDVLKKFEEIKIMQIEFPLFGSGIGLTEGCDSLVKWKAVFGRELKGCIIVGATSVQKSDGVSESSRKEVKEHEQDEQFLTDDELRLRIIWTVSCLIAASARHHFLKQIVSDHPSLQNVVINDRKNQGKLCMGQEELVEMRNSMDSSLASPESSLERTPVPDLSIKMSYVPVLELPGSGYTMKGATLIVIRPVDGLMRKEMSDGEDLLGSGFDVYEDQEKAFGETVKEMMKMRKNYVMTMNSF